MHCKDCQHFDEDVDSENTIEGDGYCREDSPKIIPPGLLGKHPRVFKNGYCGKNKQKIPFIRRENDN